MSRTVSIRGLLTAIDWASDDSVRRVTLNTADEDEYCIELDDDNRGLLDHLREEVVVTGVVTTAASGDKTLAVSTYGRPECDDQGPSLRPAQTGPPDSWGELM